MDRVGASGLKAIRGWIKASIDLKLVVQIAVATGASPKRGAEATLRCGLLLAETAGEDKIGAGTQIPDRAENHHFKFQVVVLNEDYAWCSPIVVTRYYEADARSAIVASKLDEDMLFCMRLTMGELSSSRILNWPRTRQ